MKRILWVSAVAALLLLGVEVRAGVVTLNFVGLQDQEAIQNYYNGGFGGNGSGPGPNYGITFGADSLALISSQDGGSGNFTNAPSSTVAFFLNGPGDVMNVAAGFNTGFSFFYADQVGFTGSVSVFSGLDGSGTQLASLSLPSTPDPYNVWVPIGVAFSGTAQSVIFSGSANFIGFDNITLGAAMPTGSTPEPASLTLLGLGGLGLAGYGWRRRKAVASV